MGSLLALILEKFTIEIIPKLPLFIRTKLYVNILKLRKVRDRIRLNATRKNPTFQDRLEYAIDSRANLNASGEKILSFNENVQIEEIQNGPVKIFKFTPKNADVSKYGIYFHGGGYFAGSIKSHKNFVSIISQDSNLVIYFFEYRLSPEHIFPAAHEDAKLAVEYIDSLHKGEQSIWMGESAGGGLATGLVVDKEFNIRPDNLILLSPWLDLSDGFQDKKYLKNSDVTIIIEGMYEVGEFYAGDYGPTNPILSPVYADIDDFPDTLIQVCTDELLYNDAIEFVKKLRDKNTNVVLQTWDKLWHAWHFFPIKESFEAVDKISDYIKSSEFQSSR